jgi:ubiquinone/menaquinone biosynthesis C-methylase UbiE
MSKQSYNKLSKQYDALAGSSEKKLQLNGLQMLDVKEGECVLEIGFGTGNGIVSLARSAGISGFVQGIDLAQGMLDITAKKVAKAGLTGWVSLTCADAMHLPFDSNRFDAVFMCFTLELFSASQIPALLLECRRVLRPNGRICVVAMLKKEGKKGMMSILYEWANRKFPEYVDCRPINASEELQNSGFHISQAKQMAVWCLPVEAVLAHR